MMNDAIKTVII